MAATVDLGQQLRFENVSHLPPRAPSANDRPCSGGFQNRGHLFSTLKQQVSSEHTQTYTVSAEVKSPDETDPNRTSNTIPSFRQRHVQSAKARLQMSHASANHHFDDNNSIAVPGSDIAVFDVNRNLVLEQKPARRSLKDGNRDSAQAQFIEQISLNKSTNRPSSAKNSGWTPVSPATDLVKDGDDSPEDLKPSVFGYRLKRQVYGSNPDIFTADLEALQPTTMFKLDETSDSNVQRGGRDVKSIVTTSARGIPAHMEPLRPWLHQTVPQEVIGVDPTQCLVFLPVNQNYHDLPVVPFL